MKLKLIHNHNMKTFTDIVRYVELGEKYLVFERGAKKIFLVETSSKEASSPKKKGKLWKGKSKKPKQIACRLEKNFKENKKSKQFHTPSTSSLAFPIQYCLLILIIHRL